MDLGITIDKKSIISDLKEYNFIHQAERPPESPELINGIC
jgi:hypothetical protein